jgi:hypothetical protein
VSNFQGSVHLLVDTMTGQSIEMVEGLVVWAPPGGRRTRDLNDQRMTINGNAAVPE